MKAQKFEIVVPVWPNGNGTGYFGGTEYTKYGSSTGCDSACISLRAVIEGDKWPIFNDEVKTVNDLSLYVWFDAEGSVCIDMRHSAYSGHNTMREMEASVRMMKKLIAKINKKFPLNGFVKASIHTQLTLVLDALGVKRCVEYNGYGKDDTYKPIGIAVAKIAEILDGKKAMILKAA